MSSHRIVSTCLVLVALWPVPSSADQTTDTGTVIVTIVDPTGAAVAHASMTIARDHDAEPLSWSISAIAAGVLTARELPAARYRIRVEAAGFEPATLAGVRVSAGEQTRRTVRLELEHVAETVVVSRDAQREVIDPRGFSTFLSREQIDALPDDPESFARALQALAPPGAVIRIDGFTGGRLPPKSQILSIRIPRLDTFAAQDHGGLEGLSFIDLVTRPGGGHLAGSADLLLRSSALDARNALSPEDIPTSARTGTLALDGPVVPGIMSFSLSARAARREDGVPVHAALPGDELFATTILRPQHVFTLSGRVATALGSSHVLRVSFASDRQTTRNLGVGGIGLPERAYDAESSELTVRIAGGGPLGRRGLLDVRTQIRGSGSRVLAASDAPAIHVLEAFSGGGAQVAGGMRALEVETAVDVDYGWRAHAAKFGGLIEHGGYRSRRASNYLGTYTFASLADFADGRPASFTRRWGDPAVSYASSRIGLYVQDDVRAARNVLVSVGLRAELQTLASGGPVLLPRTSVAWSPLRTTTTTIRAGWGIFSDWLPQSVYEQSLVVNGTRQHDVHLLWPSYPASETEASFAPRERYTLANDLDMPKAVALSVGVEHRPARGVQLYAAYGHRVGQRLLRGHDLNAPVDRVRPDLSFANVIEARSDADSRSQTLTLQVVAADSRRRADVAVVYVLSDSRTNTTGAFNVPPTGELALEWGPASPRHMATGTITARLPGNTSIAVTPRWRSGTPYTVTTGRDDNGDGLFSERPQDVPRNSARMPSQWELGARVAYLLPIGMGDAPTLPSAGADTESLRAGAVARGADGASSRGRWRFELFASAQNLTNRVNYTAMGGVLGSPFFGRPTAVAQARTDFDVGVRFGF